MFFKHRRAIYHVRCIKTSYKRMIAETTRSIPTQNMEEGLNSGYSGPLVEILFFQVDGFFEAERSAHNFILSTLTTAGLLKSAPSSLHDFYNKAKKEPGSYLIHPHDEIEDQLTAFWEKHGERTKDYRDCFSHFAALSGATWQHNVNMIWANGSWNADFELPDNPATKSYKSFTYDLRLDALQVCTEISKETTKLLDVLMNICLVKWNAKLDKNQVRSEVRNVRISD